MDLQVDSTEYSKYTSSGYSNGKTLSLLLLKLTNHDLC